MPQPPTLKPYSIDLETTTMGKYALAWLLGVPGIVLVLLFIVFR